MSPCKRFGWLALLGLYAVGMAYACVHANECPEFESAAAMGQIETRRISEASGIAASQLNAGVIWIHNDSGDDTRFYAVDFAGRFLGSWGFPDIEPLDCEDMAIGPRPESDLPHLFLADIGDNARARPSIRIYVAPEPRVSSSSEIEDQILEQVEILEAVYPDGPHDAEVLLVDPISGDLYVVCKEYFDAPVYRIPAGVDVRETVVMEHVATIPWGLATGGDVAHDGTEVLVRGYWNISLWRRNPAEPLWSAFEEAECRLPYALEPQGEAIAFTADAEAYLTLSEGQGATVYRFDRER